MIDSLSEFALEGVIFGHGRYWATAASIDEAAHLTAVLNSEALREMVQSMQARGEHNPRNVDKYASMASIPEALAADGVKDIDDEAHLLLTPSTPES